MPTLTLTHANRRSILNDVVRAIDTKCIGPSVDTQALRQRHERLVLSAQTSEAFESAVNGLLKDLAVSHTGFFHESASRATGRIAIAATFTKAATTDGDRWMFQDVHPGGAAAAAGIRPGDVLLSVAGREVAPPDATPFSLGEHYEITLRRRDGSTARPTLTIPPSKDRRRPLVVPDQVVTSSKLPGGIGLIRVSMFPGTLGMDVARDMSRAIHELDCGRLIFDLRGNTGGGIGCLRLMSLLCTDRRGVGYSVGRSAMQKGYSKEQLPRFDRIPASKWGAISLIPRFAFAGRSAAVYTEGLGPKPHHGKTVVLVNEHSASAAEMVAAFASECGLATLVGEKTAGRLVGASSFKVGFGYRVALPVASYFTWRGTNLEGHGVEPNVTAATTYEALRMGTDNQLERARTLLASL